MVINSNFKAALSITIGAVVLSFMGNGIAQQQSIAPSAQQARTDQQASPATGLSPLSRIEPDYIQMGNGEKKALNIETIAKLNEEISRKEFESKLRDLFKIEVEQLAPATTLPPVEPAPVEVVEPEPVPVAPPTYKAFLFDTVFGQPGQLNGEIKNSDGKVYGVARGYQNEFFKVHEITPTEVKLEFCSKALVDTCDGKQYQLKLGQLVLFQEK